MTKKLSRREILSAGSIAGLSLIGAGVSGYAVGKEPASTEFPWTYKKLRKKKTSARGYSDYFQAGCMYGVFEAIVGQLGDKYGEPYSSFPMGMISYGGGGIALWGSTCGTLNGAAAAIALFVTGADRNAIIDELFAWYETAALPTYKPKKAIRSSKPIKKSKAGSVLCHASVSNWCEVSGYGGFSAERAERCGRLVADVAAKTVDLLNLYLRGKFQPKVYSAASCLSCHGKGNMVGDTLAKMGCTSCHEDAQNPHN